MKKQIILLLAAAATIFSGSSVLAAEPGIDSFKLWSSYPDDRFINFDIFPDVPGVEVLIIGETIDYIDLGNDQLSIKTSLTYKVRSANGKSQLDILGQPFHSSSGSIPDPDAALSAFNNNCYFSETAVNYPGVCAGANNARTRLGRTGMQPATGMGVARADSGDVVVVGTGVSGYWYGSAGEGEFGEFRVFVYNGTNLNTVCKMAFPAYDENDMDIDWKLGSVGDYLSDNGRAGQDEIRIFSWQNTKSSWRIRLYDPTNCRLLSSTAVAPPVP